MKDKIYEMELHELLHIKDLEIIRVPGGWIYTKMRLDCGQMNSVFVPFIKGAIS